jgi:L-alanine-DL-glutamate epimerase-like enolase superfamily enzyme
MRLTWTTLSLTTTFPFAIARWGYAAHENVIVTITDTDGVTGQGEAAPNRYYGESVDSVVAALALYAPILAAAAGTTWSIDAIETAMFAALRGNASARAAVSAALHDLHAKRLGAPLHRVWGLDPTHTPTSSYTIGIADDDGIRARVRAAAAYPILKIKLGTDRDDAIVRTVREAAPDKIIRVDANAAWTPRHAVRMAYRLHEYGVESIEQPVDAADLDGLRAVTRRSPLPIIADESCRVVSDIPMLAGRCDGINIKLAKCGSLREAMRMVHVARAHHLRVMAGCMIETSLGISAIAQLAPLLDDADFDGAALLAHDPFVGVTIPGGRVTLTDAPGLGVSPAAAAAASSSISPPAGVP